MLSAQLQKISEDNKRVRAAQAISQQFSFISSQASQAATTSFSQRQEHFSFRADNRIQGISFKQVASSSQQDIRPINTFYV